MSVYFARVKGYVKIGYSKDPLSRVNTITTGSCLKPLDVEYGDTIHLLGWIPGDRKVELAMHNKFLSNYVIGEWFWDDDAYDALIEDHDFGIPWPATSYEVIRAMEEYPHATRARVTEAVEKAWADKFADPNSEASQLRSMFGITDEWNDAQVARLNSERAADRAYWRSQRAAA